MTTSLCFNDVTLAPISHNNQIWIRGIQIGSALRYEQPDASIAKIYARHAEEFTDAMTAIVTLPTEGGPQETRIFSLRGCHLIAMFARTAIAKQFRRWVLDVLDKLAQEERAGCSALPTDPLTLTPTRSSERAPLAKLVKVWANQTRTHPAQCWAMINARFVLDSIDQLPLEWLLDATAFVQTKIDTHNAPPPPPPLPAPDTTSKAELAAARSALRADVEMLHRMADILQTQITGKIELFKEVANGMLAVKRG